MCGNRGPAGGTEIDRRPNNKLTAGRKEELMNRNSKKNTIILGIALGVALLVLAAVFIVFSVMKNGGKSTTNGPFNVVVTFGDDPATQKNFSWYTETGSEQSIVQYYAVDSAAAAAKPDFKNAQQAEGFVETVDTFVPAAGQENSASASLEAASFVRHGVYIDGLRPGATYVYRVGDGKSWSGSGVFETAPETAVSAETGFKFLIVGDSQGYTQSDFALWAGVYGAAVGNCPDSAFTVHLGDFIENEDNALAWRYCLTLPGELRSATLVPVAGNKEDDTFLKYFLLGTREGVTGLNGYYSFDYMNVHFTVLNTGDGSKDLSKAQIKWLRRDLESEAAKNAAWRVVLIHKAPYSDRNHADDSEIVEIRAQLLPEFETYNVDVVIEAHDHYYFRSEPVKNGGLEIAEYTSETVTSGGEQVTFFRAASGGDMGGVFYFMPGPSGVRQHSKGFREMPEILAAKSLLLSDPTFCRCEVTAERISFYTFTVDRYNYSVKAVECWGISK